MAPPLPEIIPNRFHEARMGGDPTPIFRIGCRAVQAATWLAGGLDVVGAEHLRREDAFIVASTHRAEFESPLSGMVIHRETGKQPHFLAAKAFWQKTQADGTQGRRLYGERIQLFGAFPVASDFTMSGETSRHINSNLEHGGILFIYPEKRVLQGQEVDRPLRLGAMWYSILNQVPIVPVAFGGFQYGNYGRLTMYCLPALTPPPFEAIGEVREYRKAIIAASKEFREVLRPQLQLALDTANAISATKPSTLGSNLLNKIAMRSFRPPPQSRPKTL